MEALKSLPIMDLTDNETGCCPRFYPEAWDNKTFEFDNLLFAKVTTRSVFHLPLNMNAVFTKAMAAIDSVQAHDPDRYLILSRDVSMWKAEHYFSVIKDVPGLNMVRLNGTYMTKVFDGDFRKLPKMIQATETFIHENGQEMKEQFAFYTTCPKCSKHYGHNYIVIFGRVA